MWKQSSDTEILFMTTAPQNTHSCRATNEFLTVKKGAICKSKDSNCCKVNVDTLLDVIY